MTDNFHLGDNRIELAELVADAFDNAQLDTIFKNRFRVPANRVCSGFNGSSLEFANGIIDYLENQGLFISFLTNYLRPFLLTLSSRKGTSVEIKSFYLNF